MRDQTPETPTNLDAPRWGLPDVDGFQIDPPGPTEHNEVREDS